MEKQHPAKDASITEEYEARALSTFRAWYRQNQPTINETAAQAAIIAGNTVGNLTMLRIILLLKEHPEWTYRPLPINEGKEVSISGMARMHLIKHLEQTIQQQGLKAIYAANV